MKVDDLYGLDDKLEHFVIHSAEEELASIKILNVEIKKRKSSSTLIFNFYCEFFDNESRSSGRQDDLSQKIQSRVDKFHKNFIKNVEINVYKK